jgi:hypothetical protein
MRFEDLDVWKRSSRLCVNVYKELADCKDFGFKDQIIISGSVVALDSTAPVNG